MHALGKSRAVPAGDSALRLEDFERMTFKLHTLTYHNRTTTYPLRVALRCHVLCAPVCRLSCCLQLPTLTPAPLSVG